MPPSPFPPFKPRWRKALVSHGWLAVILVGFSALVLPTIGQGMSSWDSEGIMRSVRRLLDHHHIYPSRPPGHPTTEYFIFGAIGWCLGQVGRPFDDAVFLTLQWLAALAVAFGFHAWLRHTGISPARAALAVVCLLLSPQFLDQTLNGEEVLWGLSFLLGAAAVLACEHRGALNRRRLAVAILLFALATGCRSEFVLAGFVIFPVHLLRLGVRDWKTWLISIAVTCLAIAVVWAPLIPFLLRIGPRLNDVADVSGPLFLVWGYKVLFPCFGFPASVALLMVLIPALLVVARGSFRLSSDWVRLVCVAIPPIYLALFRFQPGKPAYVLVCLPFLLWLTAQRHIAWLLTVTALTVTGAMVGVDVVHGRRLTPPFWTPGAYQLALKGKPYHQLAYIKALEQIPLGPKAVLVGDAWTWVYNYHLDRGTFQATAWSMPSGGVSGFALGGNPDRLILPRDFILEPNTLDWFRRENYEIVMDRILWRTLYARYEVDPPGGDYALAGATPVRLVTVPQSDSAAGARR